MSNEPLGIYEELRARRERYEPRPPARTTAYAQPYNPFTSLADRIAYYARRPGYHRNAKKPARWRGSRIVWPEAQLERGLVRVMEAVVAASAISLDDMLGNRQSMRVAWPRQVGMWAVDRYCPEYSYTEMGLLFRRDHTTVIYGIRIVDRRLEHGHSAICNMVAKVREQLDAA